MIIKMVDIRKAKMCSKGARNFFERHNLNWNEFLEKGIDSEKLKATGDAMALHVVEIAEKGK